MLVLPSNVTIPVYRDGKLSAMTSGGILCFDDVIAPSPIKVQIAIDDAEPISIAENQQFRVPDIREFVVTHDFQTRVNRARIFAGPNQTLGDELSFAVSGVSHGQALITRRNGDVVIPITPLLAQGFATLHAPGDNDVKYSVELKVGDDEIRFHRVSGRVGSWSLEVQSANSRQVGGFEMRDDLQDLDAEAFARNNVESDALRPLAMACIEPDRLSLEAYRLLDEQSDRDGELVLRSWKSHTTVCSSVDPD